VQANAYSEVAAGLSLCHQVVGEKLERNSAIRKLFQEADWRRNRLQQQARYAGLYSKSIFRRGAIYWALMAGVINHAPTKLSFDCDLVLGKQVAGFPPERSHKQ
jgi:hypothetical protein